MGKWWNGLAPTLALGMLVAVALAVVMVAAVTNDRMWLAPGQADSQPVGTVTMPATQCGSIVCGMPHSNRELRLERTEERFARWAQRHSEREVMALHRYVVAMCKQPSWRRQHLQLCREN